MSPLRILLVDDHAVVRAGLRALLKTIEDVQVVAEADNGLAGVNLARKHRPDLVIMDIAMPGLNGLEATARIKQDDPDIRVLILSMHDSKEYVLQALTAGASGYLVKDSAPVELKLALQAIRRGDSYLSPAVSKQVIERYLVKSEERKTDTVLTPRQREVLILIAQGQSTKVIAHGLQVSVKTVETHRMQLMERLGINDIAGLVRYAIRTGLVDASV